MLAPLTRPVRGCYAKNGTITWLLSDNLGSTSTTAAADGSLLDTVKYTASRIVRPGAKRMGWRNPRRRDRHRLPLHRTA